MIDMPKAHYDAAVFLAQQILALEANKRKIGFIARLKLTWLGMVNRDAIAYVLATFVISADRERRQMWDLAVEDLSPLDEQRFANVDPPTMH